MAVLRIAVSLPAPWVGRLPAYRDPVPTGIFVGIIIVFTATAGFLIFGGRHDRRARNLGVLFLLGAIPFTDALIDKVSGSLSIPPLALETLRDVRVDAFLPYFFWAFVRDFPRAALLGSVTRLPRVARRATLAAASALVAANLLVLGARHGLPVPVEGFIRLIVRTETGASAYYPLLFGLSVPALAFAVWKTRRARIEEQRRARLLLFSVLLGTLPTALIVILQFTWPTFLAWSSEPPGLTTVRTIAYATLLAVPPITAYAVLVQHALEVRLFVRKAIQYALARYTVLAAAGIPILLLGLLLYRHRRRTLVEILSGPGAGILLLAAVAGVVAFPLRHRVMNAIDRLFFREEYDARRILGKLATRAREVEDLEGLSGLLVEEVDRALHLERTTFLYRAPADELIAPGAEVRHLSVDARLAELCETAGEPIDVDWQRPRALLRYLPREEQEWLAEGGFHLLVPLTDRRGRLIGLLGLGEKRSELPFSGEDRELLGAMAASAAATLETLLAAGPPVPRTRRTPRDVAEAPAPSTPAAECLGCGAVGEWTAACARCGSPDVETAGVPLILAGKYRIQERVGEGGMGVVYRGVDLNLGRTVAVKTLPRISPSHAARLRREARAMATVSHPNLAAIYAAEFWQGVPILIVEYLSGGVLSDRIRKGGRLAVDEALGLGRTLSLALGAIHDAGVLHRDVKPGNIGYTRTATPKLLDFGLARISEVVGETGSEMAPSGEAIPDAPEPEGSPLPEWPTPLTASGLVLGTVAYLSPEAITGEPPDPGFDVWGLTVALYEAIAGRNPIAEGSFYDVLTRIVQGRIPDIRELRPDVPPPVARFFAEALAPERERRPRDARDLQRRLAEVQEKPAA